MATPTYQTSARQTSAGPEIQIFREAARDRPNVMRWSAVFAGAVTAIGLVYLGTLLWHALAFSSNRAFFADNIGWLDAGTSIGALFAAGILAGWLSARPQWYIGLLHGLTVWGLLIAGTIVFGFGSALPLVTLSEASRVVADARPGSFWPSFVAYGVGLVTACLGGMIGGMLPPPDPDADDVDVIEMTDQPGSPTS